MRTYKVYIPASAEKDILEIIDYIADDNPSNALSVLQRIEMRINTLKDLPEKGRIVPELRNHNIIDYHELIEPPWRIIYRIGEKGVFVLTVIDGRRNVQDILLRKLMKK